MGQSFSTSITAKMFTLQSCGLPKYSKCWSKVARKPQMVEDISRKFRISPAGVERDVREFLECLEKHRLARDSRTRSIRRLESHEADLNTQQQNDTGTLTVSSSLAAMR